MTRTLVIALVGSYLCLIGAMLGLMWHERWREFKAGAECAMALAIEDLTPDEDPPELPLVVDPTPVKDVVAGGGIVWPPQIYADREGDEPIIVFDPKPTLRERIIAAGLVGYPAEHTCGPQCTPPTGPVLQDRWRVHTACFDAYADRLPARVCQTCRPVLLGVPR